MKNPLLLYLNEYKNILSQDRNALIEMQVVDKDRQASRQVLKLQAKIKDIERLTRLITDEK